MLGNMFNSVDTAVQVSNSDATGSGNANSLGIQGFDNVGVIVGADNGTLVCGTNDASGTISTTVGWTYMQLNGRIGFTSGTSVETKGKVWSDY